MLCKLRHRYNVQCTMYIKNVGFSFESQQNILEKHFEKCTHFVDLKNIRLSSGTLETQCVMNIRNDLHPEHKVKKSKLLNRRLS